jgi:hypothetical protein
MMQENLVFAIILLVMGFAAGYGLRAGISRRRRLRRW